MTELRKNQILLIDKPTDISSFGVIKAIKRHIAPKMGHTGTLDPFASGLLLVLTNKYTRLNPFFLKADKTYHTKVKLGIRTDTLDHTGQIESEDNRWEQVREGDIKNALLSLTGELSYEAPKFSAKKIQGVCAYKYARNNVNVIRPRVNSTIYRIWNIEIELPFISFSVHCSSGTYIRSLGEMLGNILNTGSMLTELRRTRIGQFDMEGLDQQLELREGPVRYRTLQMKDLVNQEERMTLDEQQFQRLQFGDSLLRKTILNDHLQDKPHLLLLHQKEEAGFCMNVKLYPHLSKTKIISLWS